MLDLFFSGFWGKSQSPKMGVLEKDLWVVIEVKMDEGERGALEKAEMAEVVTEGRMVEELSVRRSRQANKADDCVGIEIFIIRTLWCRWGTFGLHFVVEVEPQEY